MRSARGKVVPTCTDLPSRGSREVPDGQTPRNGVLDRGRIWARLERVTCACREPRRAPDTLRIARDVRYPLVCAARRRCGASQRGRPRVEGEVVPYVVPRNKHANSSSKAMGLRCRQRSSASSESDNLTNRGLGAIRALVRRTGTACTKDGSDGTRTRDLRRDRPARRNRLRPATTRNHRLQQAFPRLANRL